MIERLSKMNQNLTLDNEGLHNLIEQKEQNIAELASSTSDQKE